MCVKELENLEYKIKSLKIEKDRLGLAEFLNLPSKRLRPRVIFLILKMLGLEITEKHMNLALAVEMLHGASLIHDDIIDDATIRRGHITTNKQFGAKPAVLGGDYLLSMALFELAKIGNPDVINIFSKNIKKMVEGEISQFFERGITPTLEEYLNKNINKTALLFLSGVKSALLISDFNDEEKTKKIENFTLGFGLAFQIINDLISSEDRDNLVYTIRDIFNNEEDCDIIVDEFLNELIEKTNKNLDFAKNIYQEELCKILKQIRG